ncbi:MAG TPA: hypothetical protein VGI00_13620, partial [Streptosporangiaceae bacterium]
MACAMFPVLGDTPPPWRWRNDVIVTSAFQHLVYAGTTTVVLRALARGPRDTGRAAGADVTPAGEDREAVEAGEGAA